MIKLLWHVLLNDTICKVQIAKENFDHDEGDMAQLLHEQEERFCQNKCFIRMQ